MYAGISRTLRCFAAGTCALLLAANAAAASLEANTFARVVGLDEGSESTTLLPGLSTGTLIAQTANLLARSEAASSAAGNGITAESFWAGSSVLVSPNQGTSNTLTAGANLVFEDLITVSSASLAVGTPVQVQFALFGAADLAVSHDIASSQANNRADASVTLTGRFGETIASGQRVDFGGNNVAATSTAIGAVPTAMGLFAPASAGLLYTLDTQVGRTLELVFRPRSAVTGGVSVGGTPFGVKSGQASSKLALVFGASANLGDVELLSDFYNGAFPALDLASAGAAQALLGAAPVPVPAGLALLAGALPALVVRRRRAA
ncbi:MAG: hypothetical protein RLW61_07460 [Gammaproteobacteria bacterium]